MPAIYWKGQQAQCQYLYDQFCRKYDITNYPNLLTNGGQHAIRVLPGAMPLMSDTKRDELTTDVSGFTEVTTTCTQSINGVSFSQISKLRRGINYHELFNLSKQLDGDITFKINNNQADIDLIKELGFTFIRFPIDANIFFDEDNPDTLVTTYLDELQDWVEITLNSGLAVMLSLWHPLAADPSFETMATDSDYRDKVADYYGAFATWVKARSEDIFIETINEPHFQDFIGSNPHLTWGPFQEDIYNHIRANAPNNTVVEKSHSHDGQNQLDDGITIHDNVIVSVHYYNPFSLMYAESWFNGADYQNLLDVPYPVQKTSGDTWVATQATVSQSRAQEYIDTRWNLRVIRAEMEAYLTESEDQQYQVGIFEGGFIRGNSNLDGKIYRLEEFRKETETRNTPWALWNHRDVDTSGTDGFSLVDAVGQTRTVNTAMRNALGLNT